MKLQTALADKIPYHFCYVYILKSIGHIGEFYIGFTKDLRRRLQQHNNYEAFSDETSARKRELNLKHNGNHMRELKKRIGLNVRKSDKGFTLIELMIVLSIISLVVGIGLFFDFDSFRGHSFNSDRDTLISALQHARAKAVNNICRGDGSECSGGKPHGVYIDDLNDKYVIFQGSNYSSSSPFNVILDASPTMTYEVGSLAKIVFEQLSGNVTSVGDIKLKDDASGRTSVITINSEGQIIWTN